MDIQWFQGEEVAVFLKGVAPDMSTILQLSVTHRDITAEYFECYVILNKKENT